VAMLPVLAKSYPSNSLNSLAIASISKSGSSQIKDNEMRHFKHLKKTSLLKNVNNPMFFPAKFPPQKHA